MFKKMVQTRPTKNFLKQIYQNDNGLECVSISTIGNTYVNMSVCKHISYFEIVYLSTLLGLNYFLCTNFIHVLFMYNLFSLFLYIVTLLICLYQTHSLVFSARSQNVIFLSNIGLQITTSNLIGTESSEYLSYDDIEDFIIVEMFHRQFSVVTYLSSVLKNEKSHKILFENFSLKLTQLEIMYQCVKHVLSSKNIIDLQPGVE
uniref:Phosphatidylinositol N-acetylglucosaminyltransferase subunit H conserved domain-containing protein n=1 Tax=Cacopsylla melanoneura TaxID=428564 RepID=A0A8D8XZF4_9HEMI